MFLLNENIKQIQPVYDELGGSVVEYVLDLRSKGSITGLRLYGGTV